MRSRPLNHPGHPLRNPKFKRGDSPTGGNTKRKFKMMAKGNPRRAPSKKQKAKITVETPTPVTSTPREPYLGNLPMCNKCSYHHKEECRRMVCASCKMSGHVARFCKNITPGTEHTHNTGASHGCYNCGEMGHKRDCLKA